MPRLLLVSNRLPITVTYEGNEPRIVPSSGGLATGLQGHHQKSEGLWIGWPGDLSKIPESAHRQLEQEFADRRIIPIHLHDHEVTRYYEGFSNKLLWPLFHHMMDRIPLDSRDWDAYVKVNEKFAQKVLENYRPGDIIWVHDIHLMLVPGLLREQLPNASIGFFLHIPFPPSEVFRALPWRIQLLEGVLGADLIGFHTLSYQRHFASTLLELLGLDTDNERVHLAARDVRLGAFPIGVDAKSFDDQAQSDEVLKEVKSLIDSAEGRHLLVGVERLDYTKGIRRRLLAIERLLEKQPDLRGKIRFIQLAVPSREGIDQYAKLRRQIDELVGHINGRYGDARSVPVHYLYRSVPREQLVALYRAAQVMLVTPTRDGMNLVSKEFVASRSDGDGVLVLSEFAGAAQELTDALIVNPYDSEQIADAIAQGIKMPEEERRLRMKALRRRVFDYDIHRWVESFLESLQQASTERGSVLLHYTSKEAMDAISQRIRAATQVQLLLDFDGTLMSFTRMPELAIPDAELKALLKQLSERPGFSVQIVTGRPYQFLERYFGDLGIGLHGEHGLWSRRGGQWASLANVTLEWKPRVIRLLEQYTRKVPGSFIEEKTATLVWHYRKADLLLGQQHAHRLQEQLAELLKDLPVEIISGSKVIEVRPQGIHKGRVMNLSASPPETLWVAIGDDTTDEDMFRQLPADGVAIHVGPAPSKAPYRLESVDAVRAFLKSIVA